MFSDFQNILEIIIVVKFLVFNLGGQSTGYESEFALQWIFVIFFALHLKKFGKHWNK